MPLQAHMRLISTDDHVVEPPTLWQERLPMEHREAGPRIIETTEPTTDHHGISIDAGAQVWLYEGRLFPQIGINAVAGRPPEEFGFEPARFDQMRPGCYEPGARVSDMDLDGVQAQLCFPSFPRFAGTTFLRGTDRDLGLACVQAFNDWILEDWCGSAPTRLIPMAILPLWDAELAAAEVHRVAAKGAKAISFIESPEPLGLPSFHTDHWDPVLTAVQDTDLALCMHFGTSGKTPTTAADAPFAVTIALMGTNSMWATVDLLFSPVLHKFPRLRIALAEGGIGWIPYILERADYTWERHRHYMPIDKETRPSELFRRHFWGCYIDDEFGLRNREEVGIDRITFESDYPHSDSNWPDSRKRAAKVLADVPDADAHRIVELNARELLRFDADLLGQPA